MVADQPQLVRAYRYRGKRTHDPRAVEDRQSIWRAQRVVRDGPSAYAVPGGGVRTPRVDGMLSIRGNRQRLSRGEEGEAGPAGGPNPDAQPARLSWEGARSEVELHREQAVGHRLAIEGDETAQLVAAGGGVVEAEPEVITAVGRVARFEETTLVREGAAHRCERCRCLLPDFERSGDRHCAKTGPLWHNPAQIGSNEAAHDNQHDGL